MPFPILTTNQMPTPGSFPAGRTRSSRSPSQQLQHPGHKIYYQGGRLGGGALQSRCILLLAMQPKTRQVYFRRKDKVTYAIAIKPNTTLKAVELFLSKREGIRPENIMLFHRGKPLPFTLQGLPSAGPECIVHVVDLDGVKRGNVSFNLRGLDGQTCRFTLNASTKVKDLVQHHLTRVDQLPHFYIGLVYLGKVLSPERTLFEEFVEEGCELVAVNMLDLQKRKRGDENLQLRGGKVAAEQQDSRLQSKNGLPREQTANQPQSQLFQSNNQQPLNAAADRIPHEMIVSEDKTQQVLANTKVENLKSAKQQPQELADLEIIPFNIQVSKVESVDSEQGQHNHVKFYHEEDPFDQTNNPSPSGPEFHIQKLGQSTLTGEQFIITGGGHESQTQSFIDRLMKKYKIMFE